MCFFLIYNWPKPFLLKKYLMTHCGPHGQSVMNGWTHIGMHSLDLINLISMSVCPQADAEFFVSLSVLFFALFNY